MMTLKFIQMIFSRHIMSFYSNFSNIPGVFGCTFRKRVNQKVTKKRNKLSYHKSSGWLFFPQNYAYGDVVSVVIARGNLSVRRSFAIDVGGMDENYQKGAHREEADFLFADKQ